MSALAETWRVTVALATLLGLCSLTLVVWLAVFACVSALGRRVPRLFWPRCPLCLEKSPELAGRYCQGCTTVLILRDIERESESLYGERFRFTHSDPNRRGARP